MALTDDQWATAQEWIGSVEERETFQYRVDRHGSIDAAILASLREQLNSLVIGQAASLTVEDISLNYSANIKALEKMIEDVQADGTGIESGTGSVVFSKMKRKTFR